MAPFSGNYGDGYFVQPITATTGSSQYAVFVFPLRKPAATFYWNALGGGFSDQRMIAIVDRKEQWVNSDGRSDNRNATFHDYSQTSMRPIHFAGTYGRGMFRSSDSAKTWRKINKACLHFTRAFAISSNGHIFVGADFVAGAGGVYRSTDNERAGSRSTTTI